MGFFLLLFSADSIAQMRASVMQLPSSESKSFLENAENSLEIGLLFWEKSDLDSAHLYWKDAELNARKAEKSFARKEVLIDALNLLGVVSDAQGNLGDALSFSLEAWELRRTLSKLPLEEIAYANNNIGALYFSLGDWEKANAYFGESQRNYLSDNNPIEAAWPMTNQGLAMLRYENFDSAIALFSTAEPLVLKSQDAELRASLYNNWALALIQIAELARAKTMLLNLLQFRKLPGKQRHIAEANLGFAALESRDFKQAIQLLELAKSPDEFELSAFHIAKIDYHLAQAFLASNQFEKALNICDQGIRLLLGFNDSQTLENTEILWISYDQRSLVQLLQLKALVLRRSGDELAAMEIYRSAVLAADQFREGIDNASSKLFLSGFLLPLYEAALDNAAQIDSKYPEKLDLELVFGIFQRNKANLLREERHTAQALQHSEISRNHSEQLRILRYEMRFFLQKRIDAQAKGNQENIDRYAKKLFDATQAYEKLEAELLAEFPFMKSSNLSAQIPKIADVQSFCQLQKTNYLEYFLSENACFAFRMDGNRAKFLKLTDSLSQPVSQIQKSSSEFLRACSDWNWIVMNPDSAAATIYFNGNHLFTALIKPVFPDSLPSRLHIVPDSYLGQIPFEAFVTENYSERPRISQFPWLIYETELTYDWSASLMMGLPAKSDKADAEVLAFAPMASGGKVGEFRAEAGKALPGTAKELAAISNCFKGRFLLGDSASKVAFLRLASDFDMIHLAMHGLDDFLNVGRSHIDFANQQKLYAWEIANLDLRASLVVLSACETGTGKIAKGEGVLSLGRNFIAAGASSVVMSLWKLEDRASSDIMDAFYRALQTGNRKSEALRSAKLQFLSQADDFIAQPAYWAGLVQMGNENPVIHEEHNAKNYRLFSFIFLLIGLSGLWIWYRFWRRTI